LSSAREVTSTSTCLVAAHAVRSPSTSQDIRSSQCASSITSSNGPSPDTASNKSNSEWHTFENSSSASPLSGDNVVTLGSCSTSRLRYVIDSGAHPSDPGNSSSLGTRSTNTESGRRSSCG